MTSWGLVKKVIGHHKKLDTITPKEVKVNGEKIAEVEDRSRIKT